MRGSRAVRAALAVATAGLTLGPWGALTAPASAAPAGAAVGTVTFSCRIGSFPAYTWTPTVTVSAVRPANSTMTSLTGHVTDMAGKAPVKLNYDASDSLTLDLDGTTATPTGSGHVKTTEIYQDFALPDVSGTVSSAAATVTVTAKSFSFLVDPTGMKMSGVCTPTGAGTVGTMKIVTGVAPTPTVQPTTTSSATATPSASATATATASADASGTPAQGKVTFACLLNQTSSKFTYPVTIAVSGYRPSGSSTLSLSATMSDIPGIAPVVVDGTMDVTLGVTVGGAKASLTGSTHAKASPYQVVPVPTLTGSVTTSGDDLTVVARSFRFSFPDMSIDADCTAATRLTKVMKVGTKASTTTTSSTSTSGSSSTSGSGTSSTLPKTGASNLGLMLTGGLGLVVMGAAGLILVRRLG
ncbi:LPXTG cell wall anchor domain-containing protein [Nocardioides sp.]|uniref:LPXTG cell wall anchor domain-containing protein n=1 Tax=Nocardioides sp. TaxID=35761 RepID=UPI002634254A|nr:LPXTG cell wall anchor domain-containing protein [Nocardioides sp.]